MTRASAQSGHRTRQRISAARNFRSSTSAERQPVTCETPGPSEVQHPIRANVFAQFGDVPTTRAPCFRHWKISWISSNANPAACAFF